MKYYIYRDEELMQVSAKAYEKWMEEEDDILPPNLRITVGENIYEMEFNFNGMIEEGEELEPFMITYSKSALRVSSSKIEEICIQTEWETFATEKEMQARRLEIVKSFKNDKFPLLYDDYEDDDDDEKPDEEEEKREAFEHYDRTKKYWDELHGENEEEEDEDEDEEEDEEDKPDRF